MKIPSGPHKLKLNTFGPYGPTGNPAEVWYYRERGKFQLHLQAPGPRGLMHYIVEIPARTAT